MALVVRPYRRGGWHVDIRLTLPDGQPFRERKVFRTASKSAAQRWGQDRERHLLVNGLPKTTKEVPTIREFWPRFLEGHVRANRQKPSGIESKEMIARVHLLPSFGDMRLDAISTERVQQLKAKLSKRAPKTVNNVLTVFNTLLKKALEWDVIDHMPCTVRLLPVPKSAAGFYSFDEYERLVVESDAGNGKLIAPLGGEAGLRCGEMLALEWDDVDLERRQLCVRRSDWRGHVTTPKGGRIRYVPLTARLAQTLKAHRHLRSPRVLSQRDGSPLTHNIVADHVRRAARRAHLHVAAVHRLRHTFCSHLAMRGAPTRAIQELAGHAELGTTQRYMHLSPAALESAIRLLDQNSFGNLMATGAADNGK
jgi:integrase